MKILVTGTEGYLGSLLPSLLMQRGHEVLGVDTGFYKVGWLYNGTHLTAKTLNKDIRDINPEDLEGVEAIVHMAELSNDPTGQLSPTITYDINHLGSVRLANLAKSVGVRRFVYMLFVEKSANKILFSSSGVPLRLCVLAKRGEAR